MNQLINMRVNGQTHQVRVKSHETLLSVLRDKLGLTGTKNGCDLGECGGCTVLISGRPVTSCLTLAISVRDQEITTIEGMAADGRLHPLQKAFIEHGAVQCGYCTSGMLLSAKALLDVNPDPTEADIKQYLVGNLCRCTGYAKIIKAIQAAAWEIREAK